MAKFQLSLLAEADLLHIGEYTLNKWGEAQAARYIGDLEVCCQMLADIQIWADAAMTFVPACVAMSMASMFYSSGRSGTES